MHHHAQLKLASTKRNFIYKKLGCQHLKISSFFKDLKVVEWKLILYNIRSFCLKAFNRTPHFALQRRPSARASFQRTMERRNVLERGNGASELETYEAAGHGFSQHTLSVLAVAFHRRHFSFGKCQGSSFTGSSKIITLLSSVGTHIPHDFCA